MAKEDAKSEKKTEKKPVEEKKNLITTKHLADRLKTKPAALRRWLRTLPSFKDGTYTRYKWDADNKTDAQFLKDAEASYTKHKAAESEKNKKRLEDVKKKGEEKKTEAKGKKTAAADEPDETEEIEEEDEEEIA